MHEAMQVGAAGGSFDPTLVVSDVLKLGFTAAVAWYLLTQTTKALRSIADELAALRGEFISMRSDLRKDVDEIKRDVHDIEGQGRDRRKDSGPGTAR